MYWMYGSRVMQEQLPRSSEAVCRKVATGQAETGKTNSKGLDRTRKINWPDLVFGPVNVWSLPPASFFYRKLDEKR